MLIAHPAGTEVQPGVFVWQDPHSYLSCEDGLRYPSYVSIKEVHGEETVSRFYHLQCYLHPQDKEPDNIMKISRPWYLMIKIDRYQGKRFIGSAEPLPHKAVKMEKGTHASPVRRTFQSSIVRESECSRKGKDSC